jgi:hypothetical protein
MATTFCDEHVGAFADNPKGEDTWLPFPGLLTVTPANTGVARTAANEKVRKKVFKIFKELTFIEVGGS